MFDKTKSFKKLLIIVITLFSFTEAWCATYYIDFLSGLDSNNGLSPSTPFKHCPGDNNAANTAASRTLAAGDKVIFKGGVQYSTSAEQGIKILWSGSGDADANRIIYDGDSGTYVTRWGSGTSKAILDGGGVTKFGVVTFTGGRNYITFNNFIIRNGHDVGYSGDYFAGLIIGNYIGTNNYITVSNCDFSDAGNYVAGTSYNGICFSSNGDYLKVYNNTFTDCYDRGVAFGNSSNSDVYNNTFTGKIKWPLAFGINKNGTYTNNKIHNNTLYDISMGASYGGDGSGRHDNWLFLFNEACTACEVYNTYVYNNLFYNSYTPPANYGAGFIHHGQGDVNGPGTIWDGLYIYNNVMFNGYSSDEGITVTARGGGMKNIYIYGNTFYSAYGVGGFNAGCTGSGYYNGLVVKNNIFVSTSGGDWLVGTTCANMTGVDIDYNLYYSNKVAGNALTQGGKYYTWSAWKALGHDAHGIGLTTAPSFVSTTPESFDLTLKSDSPCIDKGVVLGPPYNTDITGAARLGAAWDMGAYPHLPRPPRNLTIVQ